MCSLFFIFEVLLCLKYLFVLQKKFWLSSFIKFWQTLFWSSHEWLFLIYSILYVNFIIQLNLPIEFIHIQVQFINFCLCKERNRRKAKDILITVSIICFICTHLKLTCVFWIVYKLLIWALKRWRAIIISYSYICIFEIDAAQSVKVQLILTFFMLAGRISSHNCKL